MFAHRFRRKDQNELLGYPLDRWGPWYPFPSFDKVIRNAIFLAVVHGWEVQLHTGEVLTQHSREVRKVKLEKVGKLGKTIPTKVEGSRDPNIPGMLLVPLTRVHPTLRYSVVDSPPETFYRYNERKRRVECLVTMMPGGLMVAWDSCGQCALSIRACTCRSVRPPRSIVHIYEVATGEPFAKPKYESRTPVFERKKEIPRRVQTNGKVPLTKDGSKLVDKENPIGSFLKELPKAKTPLTKVKAPVTLTKGTSVADFDEDAKRTADRKKTDLLKTLKKIGLSK